MTASVRTGIWNKTYREIFALKLHTSWRKLRTFRKEIKAFMANKLYCALWPFQKITLNEIGEDAVQKWIRGPRVRYPSSRWHRMRCEWTKHERIFNEKQWEYFEFMYRLVCGVYYVHGTIVVGNNCTYIPMTCEELQRTNLESLSFSAMHISTLCFVMYFKCIKYQRKVVF